MHLKTLSPHIHEHGFLSYKTRMLAGIQYSLLYEAKIRKFNKKSRVRIENYHTFIESFFF